MSATMATQGGRVQLEQSDMRLALDMPKMAKGGCSRAAMEESQFLIKKPRGEVQEEKQWGVEFPAHKNVKAAMERHPAMLWENQMDGCLHCQNGPAQDPQISRRRKSKGAPPPECLRQPTPGPMPHPPCPPPVPLGNIEAAHLSEIQGVPPGYVYIPIPLPSAQFFNRDAYAKGRKRDKDFHPDLLTDDRTSTG